MTDSAITDSQTALEIAQQLHDEEAAKFQEFAAETERKVAEFRAKVGKDVVVVVAEDGVPRLATEDETAYARALVEHHSSHPYVKVQEALRAVPPDPNLPQ